MAAAARTILTIGSFDGVHVGHRALVETCRRLGQEHDRREGLPTGTTRVVAMAFDPHPASVLRPGTEPGRLTTWESRARLLREAGADEVVRLEPTPELLGLTAEEFVERLVADHRPVAIVEGPDFRFGKGRAGDVAALRRLGRERAEADQFAVHVVEPVTVALGDQSIVTASSTMARWLIGNGRMGDAARVLGRPYRVVGAVVRGDRRGRTLGYPTANVEPETMLPGDGVYAGVAYAAMTSVPATSAAPASGRVLSLGAPGTEGAARESEERLGPFVAAVSVGTKPQFTPGQTQRTLEAHLLGVARAEGQATIPGLPEYGWRIQIDFLAWLRGQQRFDGVPGLVAQIERDCTRAREVAAAAGTLPEAMMAAIEASAGTEATGCR